MDSIVYQASITGNAFVSSTSLITVATTSETPVALITNPGANTKNMLLTVLRAGINSTTVGSIIKIYSTPTITSNGTATTPVNLILGGSASTITSFKSPTISSNGTLACMFICPANSIALDKELSFYLIPGKSILITVTNSAATSTTLHTDLFWIEQ